MMTLGRSAGCAVQRPLPRTDIWNIAALAARVRLLTGATACIFRWSPRRRQPEWSWLAMGALLSVILVARRHDGVERLLPAQLDVRSDVRAARRVRGAVAVDHADARSPSSTGSPIAAQLEAVRAGCPCASTTDRVRRPGFRRVQARRSVATRLRSAPRREHGAGREPAPSGAPGPNRPRSVGTLEGVIGVPATEGNLVEVLRNGNEIFPAMLEAIAEAEHTIDFLTFVYWRGEIGTSVRRGALASAREIGCPGSGPPGRVGCAPDRSRT